MPSVVYPGTFDPITRGHEDLVRRAVGLFGSVTVAVAASGSKQPFFDLDERVAMAREALADIPGVVVEGFGVLLVDYMRARGHCVILRGLRAVSDFEYEFQLAGMNRSLDPGVETLFLTPSDQFMFISASMVREIALLGGEVAPFVHPAVLGRIRDKIARHAN